MSLPIVPTRNTASGWSSTALRTQQKPIHSAAGRAALLHPAAQSAPHASVSGQQHAVGGVLQRAAAVSLAQAAFAAETAHAQAIESIGEVLLCLRGHAVGLHS